MKLNILHAVEAEVETAAKAWLSGNGNATKSQFEAWALPTIETTIDSAVAHFNPFVAALIAPLLDSVLKRGVDALYDKIWHQVFGTKVTVTAGPNVTVTATSPNVVVNPSVTGTLAGNPPSA